VTLYSQRLLLHSHSPPRVGGEAGWQGYGCHGELLNVRVDLSFDSVVFFRLFAEELKACSHVTINSASASTPKTTTPNNARMRSFSSSTPWGPDTDPRMGAAGTDPGGAGEMALVNAWLRYRKLVVRGSAETLPTCRRVLKRLAAIFADNDLDLKMGEGGAQVTRRTSFKAFPSGGASGGSLDDMETDWGGGGGGGGGDGGSGGGAHKGGGASGATWKLARSAVVLGGVDIKGQELHVALYGEQMTDTAECALLVLRELQWQVQIQRQEKASDLDVYRFLEMNLDTCILMRMKKAQILKSPLYRDFM
jgi:hypothetical protein